MKRIRSSSTMTWPLFAEGNVEYAVSENILQCCMFIHFCCAAVMAILLTVHIYMAALTPGLVGITASHL